MAGEMHGSGVGMARMETMGGHEVLTLGAFLVAWLAMMSAMMFPAISPVVRLYGRAAAAGRVAPLPAFVAGYIAVWSALGLPGYLGWRALMDPIAEGRTWAGRLAGVVLLLAAVWQLTPLKSVCLRHCRSPMSFFLRFGRSVTRPIGALRMGATHGLYCVGCCWALMAVLVAVGTMNVAWMAGLALLILLEKNAPHGERVAVAAAIVFITLGTVLVLHPSTLSAVT
jgi:predicted metal-binding membrane protein